MRLTAVTFALAVALAGCGESGVVRVLDGQKVEGRFISEYAYALYAQGADAEARGDLATAARAFEAAASEDGRGTEIWTRLGAVRCKTNDGAELAAEAFARARVLDPDFEPLHRELARCALRQGRREDALAEAHLALTLDPDADKTSLALAEVEERAGRPGDALRTLHALAVRRPESVEALAALHATSLRSGERGLATWTADRLARLGERGFASAEPAAAARQAEPTASDLEAIDAALVEDDGNAAARLAMHARLGRGDLAVRAAALGRTELARREAELVLGADPADASARIAAAAAADVTGDLGAIDRALAMPRAVAVPSPLARLLLAELLERHVGADAARAYIGPSSTIETALVDPLYERTARRVRARLATSEARRADAR